MLMRCVFVSSAMVIVLMVWLRACVTPFAKVKKGIPLNYFFFVQRTHTSALPKNVKRIEKKNLFR